MRMQVILDSSFARLGSALLGAGRKESSGTDVDILRGYQFSIQAFKSQMCFEQKIEYLRSQRFVQYQDIKQEK